MVLTVTLKKNPLSTEYYLHNYKLTTVSKAKYLGVTLDSKLSFNDHVDATCKKANLVLSFLRRNLRHCHRRVKVDAFVKPILNYAAPVWTPILTTISINLKLFKNVQLALLCQIIGELAVYQLCLLPYSGDLWKPNIKNYASHCYIRSFMVLSNSAYLIISSQHPELREDILLNLYNHQCILTHISIVSFQTLSVTGTSYHLKLMILLI